MSHLIKRMDKIISQVGKLGRREAFAAVQDIFGRIKVQPTASEPEVKRFFDLLTLVLLVYPLGLTIRISGAGRSQIREEHLRFDENYEVALEHTMDFLTRNFLDHLDEYDPLQYLRAALRALAKEYGIQRARQSETVPVGESAEPDEGEDGTLIYSREPVQEEAPRYLKEYEPVRQSGEAIPPATVDPKPELNTKAQRHEGNPDQPDCREGALFYDWYVGTLSRRELALLHGLTEEQVEKAILHTARDFERGRLLPLVNWLIGLKTDGDILLLFSKGLTGEQIGQKVAKSHWLIYKRLSALRKRFSLLKPAITEMCRAEAG